MVTPYSQELSLNKLRFSPPTIFDDPEVAAFTGDFIDGHGGLLLLGMGASERWMSKGLEFQTTYVWFMRVLPKMAGLG